MSDKRQPPVEIEFGKVIEFTDITRNLGRAEFQLCPVFYRGRMTDLYIDRWQQENGEWYHLNLKSYKIKGLWLSCYGLDDHFPSVWQTTWCDMHKCHSLELYVPTGSSRLEVECSFGTQVHLSFSGGK